MQKVSLALLDVIFEKCSAKEIDFILYCMQYQNELGNVRGINYKLAMLDVGISKQGFYNILRSLELKEVITVNWFNSEKDWSFTFINNVFLNYKDHAKGYLKTNFFFLHEPDFKKLRVKHKKLILKLLKVSRPDKNYEIREDQLQKWVSAKSEEEFEPYWETIKLYFNVTIYKGKASIKLKKYNQPHTHQDAYQFIIHRIRDFCSRFRIAYTMQAVKEIYFMLQDKKANANKIILALCDTALRYRSLEIGLLKTLVETK